ncbi:MAG: TCP-1/cpn60 chaperonin family protein, partial [Halobacteria archaeon]|nr:TCP-1/cpn60 chaperonin family protein [Halobacteria archaeon]
KGMDKMIVSDSNDIIITNDGSTILDKMDIEHPAADMIVEVAESQETEVGDGTTTATVLAGELLSEADDLLDDDIHPTTIVEGYHEAYEASLDAVDDMVLEEEVDDETLRAVAESSMTGKSIGDITVENLAQSVVEAVRRVESDAGVEREDIHVTAQSGKSSTATEHVEGVVFESEPTSDNMRREADDATVAVVDSPLEQRETEIDAEYSIDSADQLTSAIETEEEELGEYVEALKNADADVVFVTDDVADYVSSSLAAEGILAFDGVDDEDAEAVSKATGARRVTMVEDIDGDDLGHADSVRAESYDDDVVVVEGGEETQTVTLFVRGGTEHVLDELERAVEDGIDATVAALGGGVVPGAGSVEVAVAEEVRDAA